VNPQQIAETLRAEAHHHIDTKRKPFSNDDNMLGERIDRIVDIKIGEALLHLADQIAPSESDPPMSGCKDAIVTAKNAENGRVHVLQVSHPEKTVAAFPNDWKLAIIRAIQNGNSKEWNLEDIYNELALSGWETKECLFPTEVHYSWHAT